MSFGFVGIGIMGEGQAACLLKAGRNLVVWNRDGAKAEALRKQYPDNVTIAADAGAVGGRAAATPAPSGARRGSPPTRSWRNAP